MAVHSNDGKTWSTKLDRIGKLSASNKDMVFNNLGHLVNADMLLEQYHRLDENKAIGIDKVTKADPGIILFALHKHPGSEIGSYLRLFTRTL